MKPLKGEPIKKKIVVEKKKETSIMTRFCKALCRFGSQEEQLILTPRESIKSNSKSNSTKLEDSWDINKTQDIQTSDKRNPLFRSLLQSSDYPKTGINGPSRSYSTEVYIVNYPVTKFRENEIMVIGDCKIKMLTKITSIKLMPTEYSIQKTKLGAKVKNKNLSISAYEISQFWKSRYYLFEKFDKGIKIDNDSWYNTIPEVVSQYFADKTKCTTILDGLCGIGSTAIKFAGACHTVIVNDPSQQKMQCLDANIEIYIADNIIKMSKNFLQISNIKPDVVFLHPKIKNSQDQQLSSLNPQSYFIQPSLQQLIQKALTLSNNVVMILPGNVNIQILGVIYHNAIMKSKPNTSISCSIQIQKIYFNRKLKYVAVYYGPMVNQCIKTADELHFIYNILNEGKKTTSQFKNLIKYVRQKHGMVKLLSLTSECLKYDKQTMLQRFYEMVKANELISEKLLASLIKINNTNFGNFGRLPTLQQERVDQQSQQESEQNQRTDTDQTNSCPTNYDDLQCEKGKSVRGTIYVNGKQNMRMTLEASSLMQKTCVLQKTMLNLN